jgi:N-acetylglucosaminyldiphosphoundecaprenol N-acetyl-beta-D-mannosaminyltransferase
MHGVTALGKDHYSAPRGSSRVNFLGILLDPYTLAEAVELATAAMRARKRLQHGDVNVAKFVSLKKDPELRGFIAESDMVCADGMGIVWGCRLMGLSVPERVAGIDLMTGVIEVCAREGFRPYFLGARPEVLEKAIAELRRRYPSIAIAGWRNGYFQPEDEAKIVADVQASGADCLFVGITSPMKERFLKRYRDALNVPVQLGVGGSFDVMAGVIRRAPHWIQKLGLEWLFRFAQEPRRLGWRYLTTNTQFAGIFAVSFTRKLMTRI